MVGEGWPIIFMDIIYDTLHYSIETHTSWSTVLMSAVLEDKIEKKKFGSPKSAIVW